MIALGFSEDQGILLRSALEPLILVERRGIVSYTPDGLSLIALERYGFVIVALRIKSSDIDYFQINESGSAGIDLVILYENLQLAGDECYVTMFGDEEKFGIDFVFDNTRTNEVTFSEMELSKVEDQHIDLDGRLQFEYEVIAGIPSEEFTRILGEIFRNGDTVAFVNITDKEVMFYGSADGFILSKEHGECIIGGVEEGADQIDLEFSLVDIMSYQDAAALSITVWILQSNGAPSMLNCPVGAIGNIMFYFIC